MSRYQRNINRGLFRAFHQAPILNIQSDAFKLIIFSDHHRGVRDQADDFADCEAAYRGALEYYLEREYTLAVLGDVEELWEYRPAEILPSYQAVADQERLFNQNGRYLRFFGNHDDEWGYTDSVNAHLEPLFGRLKVYEGLRLRFSDFRARQTEIFLVHGHQGTFENDRFSAITRKLVRYIWRPLQRLTNIRVSTPATDWRLRQRHEVAMYNWAIAQSDLVLISGHTHHPIFPSHGWLTQLLSRHEELSRRPEGLDDARLERLEAEIAYARKQAQPCYFNTGCCSFSDGSITGIELASGEISLIRWTSGSEGIRRNVLDHAPLQEILSKVQEPAVPIELGDPNRHNPD